MYKTIKYKNCSGLGEARKKWEDRCKKLKKNAVNRRDTEYFF